MFLKSLKITSKGKIIREISFKKGINLIVDETQQGNDSNTGNNVGKTTTLKLIDFCLGANPGTIYTDTETKRDVYSLVKDFLVNEEVLITLVLKSNLDIDDSKEIVIERNFLSNKNKVQKINGEKLSNDEFEPKLAELIIPELDSEKPTFRQIISHNIRYEDDSINKTLKTLDRYTTDAEYETLYLFLFGCDFKKGGSKQYILDKIRQENIYKTRIEKSQTKTAYEAALSLVNFEIEDLNLKKKEFNLNKNFEADLDRLNETKYEISKTSSEITKSVIKRNLILEADQELNSRKSNIDFTQLELIYQQATNKIDDLQKTFEDLVNYHNKMIIEKVSFIKRDLPSLENNIAEKEAYLSKKLKEEKKITLEISKSASFEEMEDIAIRQNENFRKRGEYETVIKQLDEAESNIEKYSTELEKIDSEIFSDDFSQTVKNQLGKFNKHFSNISYQLYGERYAIKHDVDVNKKGQRLYKFSAFNANMSSGKKQGEISCFDVAYIMFAKEENISCLHFLLNDKKELMHDNQLVKIAEFVNENNIQFVASILKDKLPERLNNKNYFAVELSQQDKLFRIEKQIGGPDEGGKE